ncbi:MAG: glycosyltransferase [Bacteroidales bacterium]|nr:glycosyltransferase [Bacteroidales bacterium]
MSRIKVSVIIPVYNTEQYLEKCIDSVLDQTFDSFEIIAINDGSSDNSLELLRSYASCNSNIRVLDQKNKGLSFTRNLGIDEALGEYVYFLDSDDWIDPDLLSKMYDSAKKYNSSFVCCGIRKCTENELFIGYHGKVKGIGFLKGNDVFIDALEGANIETSCCTKFFLKEFLICNNLKFSVGRIYEDLLFTIQASSKSKVVSFVEDSFYNLRIRDGSITRNMDISSLYSAIDILKEVDKYLALSFHMEKYEIEIKKYKMRFILFILILGYFRAKDYKKWKPIVKESKVLSNKLNVFLSLKLKHKVLFVFYKLDLFFLLKLVKSKLY